VRVFQPFENYKCHACQHRYVVIERTATGDEYVMKCAACNGTACDVVTECVQHEQEAHNEP
jgi:predicted nucleic acid-binding Zn ribbon protein